MLVGVLGLVVTVILTRPWESAPMQPRRRVVEPEREVLVERQVPVQREVPVEREMPVERPREPETKVMPQVQRSNRPW